LVLENIIAARRYGASCLNYAEVRSTRRNADGTSDVAAIDTRTGAEITIRTRLVINCTGPWASALAQQLHGEPRPLKFSRGSHIIFNKPWNGPSLFLPIPGRARYYWVWPHPAGTMVGTTEREVSEVELDPLPSRDEIDEILDRLEKDIPDAGLSRAHACYCFAGIRTLPLRGKDAQSSVLSRKHIWTNANGILSLMGGKYTTASWTALEGVKEVARLLGRPLAEDELARRTEVKDLPGSISSGEQDELIQSLELHGVSPHEIHQLVGRYGRRLGAHYLEYVEGSGDKRIALETMIALDTEQVETLEDLMRRRLELEYTHDHGIQYLPTIRAVFTQMRPDIDFDREEKAYRERMRAIEALLG